MTELLTATYDRFYFSTYGTGPYERNTKWLRFFATLADGLVKEINPSRVLDVGCAKGFLVEALRERGVEAYGVDTSAHAIESVREDVRPYCQVGSVLDPLGRYDLVVCMEVLEHLPPDAAETAVTRLCEAADDVFFSSAPDDFAESTHVNVQPPDYWTTLFAKQGFLRDVDFVSVPPFPAWAMRFRRSTEPLHRQLAGYERRLWALWRENVALKVRAVETHNQLERQAAAMEHRVGESQLERSVQDQQAQIDALNERIAFLSDTMATQRTHLLDAHTQLLERDKLLEATPPTIIQDMQEKLEGLTAHIHHVTRHYHARGEVIEGLQREIEAHQATVALPDERSETVQALQAAVDERTAAAVHAAAEARAYGQMFHEVIGSTSWKITAPLRLLHVRRWLGRGPRP